MGIPTVSSENSATQWVRGPGLKRAIQEQIELLIVQQRLEPGDLLPPEGQLAADLGVSRGSVREAIKSLESLGIVEVRHGDGVRVRDFNFDSVFDFLSYGLVFQSKRAIEILQVREWLESAAITHATELITQAEIEQIDALLERWEVKIATGESTEQEDRNFHRMLYVCLGNDSLLSLIDIFWVVYNALPALTIGEDGNRLATVQAHRDLLNAVRERNVVKAQQKMQGHFYHIQRRFKENLVVNDSAADRSGFNS